MYHFALIPKENIYIIIPLLQISNPNISEALMQSRLSEMLTQGYECVGILDSKKLILWIWFRDYPKPPTRRWYTAML